MGAASRVAGQWAPLLAAAALAVLSLAACARVGGPAPVVAYGAQGSAPRPVPPPPVESQPGQIIVQRGDTLYAISRRTNAPLRALIDANNLQPPYVLQSGRRLIVPHVRSYRVQPGDTLYAVARRYDVGLRELVEANALTPPYGLRSGQILVLPFADASVAQSAPAVPPTPVQAAVLPPPVTSSPLQPSPPSRAAAPMTASPGTGAMSPSPPPPPPPAVASVTPSAPPPRPEPAAAAVAALPMPPAAMPAAPAERPVAEPASLATAEPPIPSPPPAPAGSVPARAGRFLWPINGPIVSDYGSKPGGLQNDGINIAAPRGTPIRAADGGVVVYAGNELRGFGNLLLIKHRGGWITAYAHAEQLLVRRGDEVKRGQIIARVGSTGGVATPQLHFEVRKGARPLNPRDYLGPQTASAAR